MAPPRISSHPEGGSNSAAAAVSSSPPSSHQQHFPAPPGGPRDAPKPGQICNPSSESWTYPGANTQMDVPGAPLRKGDLDAS